MSKEINQSSDVAFFDKEHNDFREVAFTNILKTIRDKFMSSYRFEGDDNFTISKQKVMLRQTFIGGYGGVLNLNKAILKNMSTENALMFNNKMISKTLIIPLRIAPQKWDVDNNIVEGFGTTTEKHNTSKKSFIVNKDNTAFIKMGEDGYSGWYKWVSFAYMQATGLTVLKKRVSLMDKKLVSNNANNSYANSNFDNLYNVGKTFLDVSPSSGRTLTEDDKGMQVNMANLLHDKLAKIDFTANETINDILLFLDSNRNMWNYMWGIRTNTNKKTERNLSDEFTSDEVHFSLMEQDFKEQIDVFVDQYNKVFPNKIKAVSQIEKQINKLEEKQIKMASGGKGGENNGSE